MLRYLQKTGFSFILNLLLSGFIGEPLPKGRWIFGFIGGGGFEAKSQEEPLARVSLYRYSLSRRGTPVYVFNTLPLFFSLTVHYIIGITKKFKRRIAAGKVRQEDSNPGKLDEAGWATELPLFGLGIFRVQEQVHWFFLLEENTPLTH
jgi:hypothetical protein